MLRKLLQRNSKLAGNIRPEPDLNSRPRAGEIRQQGTTETLFVSPLPLPTGQPALGRSSFSDRNHTYLELGGSNRGLIQSAKLVIFYYILVLLFICTPPIIFTLIVKWFSPDHIERLPEDLWNLFHMLFSGCFTIGLIMGLGGAWGLIGGLISDIRALKKQFPTRFNRQRREVCYIDHKRDNKVVIVPWERVVAWVSSTQMVTQYGATRMHTFGLGLEQGEGEDILFLQWAMPSDAHSLGMWEAIRRYMEEGIPNDDQESTWLRLLGIELTDLEKLPYEGLHTFEVERRIAYMNGNLHRDDEYSRRIGLTISKWPLRWWYVRRVLTFWKLPYWIAEWSHRVGRPVLPEHMQQWSQPLPPEQWAKPSEALKRASQQVQATMAKGTGFAEACATLRDR